MKKVAFIGSYDKADMIIYIAKILTNMGGKVLVIDSTVLQKTRYIVPAMKVLKQYITTYENIDIAIGFENINQIKEYQKQTGEEFNYDYVLIDIDSYKGYVYYQIEAEDKKYFITSFDLYSLKRGLQVLKKIEESTTMTKVLFTKDMDPSEEKYFDYISKGLKIKWDKIVLYFPFDLSDQNAIFIAQRSEKIQLKGVSNEYIDGLMFMVEEISGEKNQAKIRKAVKML